MEQPKLTGREEQWGGCGASKQLVMLFSVTAYCSINLSLVGPDGPAGLLWLMLPPRAHLWAALWRGSLQSGLIVGLQGSMWVILGHSVVTEKFHLCGRQDSNAHPSWISQTQCQHINHSATIELTYIKDGNVKLPLLWIINAIPGDSADSCGGSNIL